tara:strand:+ start:617 stop:1570 length:954 start_codon:yes stop_codon:yes gene_type:complete
MTIKQNLNTIILAAGKGSRMKSSLIKVLHQVAGKPIISHVIESVEALSSSLFLVVGHQSTELQKTLTLPAESYIEQKEQLGTGHATQQVIPQLNPNDNSNTLILAGDCPLIEQTTIQKLISFHSQTNSAATILSANIKDPTGYGRILRTNTNDVIAIKEHKDCSPQEQQITEINSGIYIFKTQLLIKHIFELSSNNNQAEYYLTDIIQILKNNNHPINALVTQNAYETMGINTRQELAAANKAIYNKINQFHMNNGITIVDPTTTYIDKDVIIGQDTIIQPFTILSGNTKIGAHCTINSFSHLNNITLSDNKTYSPN